VYGLDEIGGLLRAYRRIHFFDSSLSPRSIQIPFHLRSARSAGNCGSMKHQATGMTEQAPVALSEIIASLRARCWFLNLHYEAAWTESWSHRRCMHGHQTLIDAAKCAMPHGAGWYVFAVECSTPRELSDEEDEAVNNFRFRDTLVQGFRKQVGART